MSGSLAEPLNPPLDKTWMLPRDLPAFLRVLRKTKALGATDAERLTMFMTFQQAAWMPTSLRRDVGQYLRGEGEP